MLQLNQISSFSDPLVRHLMHRRFRIHKDSKDAPDRERSEESHERNNGSLGAKTV